MLCVTKVTEGWDIGIAFAVVAMTVVTIFEICISIIIQHRMIIFVLHIDHGGIYFGCQLDNCYVSHLTLTSVSCSTNLVEVFMIRSVSPLPYKIGTPNLVHSLTIVGTCWSGNCLLTLTSSSWSTDLSKFYD